jgi:uncharacterized membrane protein
VRAAAIGVALAGLGIAGYLTAVHYSGGTPVCAVAHGCATVQHSDYASLAGVPVAVLGLLGYVAILAALARDEEEWRTAAAFLSLAGLGFSAWLTYVEVGVLNAICMAALAVLTIYRMMGSSERA